MNGHILLGFESDLIPAGSSNIIVCSDVIETFVPSYLRVWAPCAPHFVINDIINARLSVVAGRHPVPADAFRTYENVEELQKFGFEKRILDIPLAFKVAWAGTQMFIRISNVDNIQSYEFRAVIFGKPTTGKSQIPGYGR